MGLPLILWCNLRASSRSPLILKPHSWRMNPSPQVNKDATNAVLKVSFLIAMVNQSLTY
ncbi:hypothetical protein Dimus_001567, partial [Dionaea muscipula]